MRAWAFDVDRRTRRRNVALDLDVTFRFHRAAEALGKSAQPALARMAAGLATAGAVKEKGRPMNVGLSGLFVGSNDYLVVAGIADRLHRVVEKAIAWVFRDRRRLEELFPEHRRMFPFLERTPGSATVQFMSRYDAVLSEAGELRVIELNSGDPAGYLLHERVSAVALNQFAKLGLCDVDCWQLGTPRESEVVERFFELERAADVEPGAVAVLYDEGRLSLELELYRRAFERRGRKAIVADAAEIAWRDGRAYLGNDYVSVSYNKFRISTPGSRRIGWKPGFERRYRGFLAAAAAGALVTVNNLTALTIPEDKSFLRILFEREFRAELTAEEVALVDRHVAWTTRLEPGEVRYYGDTADLFSLARELKEYLVIKPANESRGYRVTIGAAVESAEWEAALASWDQGEPMVVQEYVRPQQFPVLQPCGSGVAVSGMHASVSLALLAGRLHGLIPRASPDPVGNVMRGGLPQPAFVRRPGRTG